jgi:septum formation protein
MDEAEVAFAPYNQEQVHDYIHNFQPFDKAGGYGIQDHPPFIDSVHGDYYTVMGLPINRLLKIFSHYGIVKSC